MGKNKIQRRIEPISQTTIDCRGLEELFGEETMDALYHTQGQMFKGRPEEEKSEAWRFNTASLWLAKALRVGKIAEGLVSQYGLQGVVEAGCGLGIPSAYLKRQGISVYSFDKEAIFAGIKPEEQSHLKTVSEFLWELIGVPFEIAHREFDDVALEQRAGVLYIADSPAGFGRKFLDFVLAAEIPFVYVPSHREIRGNKKHPSYGENRNLTRGQVLLEVGKIESNGKFSVSVEDLPYQEPLFHAAIIGIPYSIT